MSELFELTALEQTELLRSGQLGVVELTRHYLNRIETFNPTVHALSWVANDLAIERATALHMEGPTSATLWGLPLADKDLLRREGMPTGYGSAAIEPVIEQRSDELATVLDLAGTVSLGKTATPEFGLYGYTAPAHFPATSIPDHPELNAGGSSGGAAAAVAGGMLPFAVGSDGGGSVRIPAATCGLVGIKPSRGLLSIGSAGQSLGGLSVYGPIARTVADAALLLAGMLHPQQDATADISRRLRDGGTEQTTGLTIGMTLQSPWDHWCDITVDEAWSHAATRAAHLLEGAGNTVSQLSWQPDPSYPELFRTVWQASAASVQIPGSREPYLEPITRSLRQAGAVLTSAQLNQTLQGLKTFERDTVTQFSDVDVVLTPTLARSARRHDWWDSRHADHNFVQQVQVSPFTSFVNVAGLPAITIPLGHDQEGLPVGVQLIGKHGGEETLLGLAATLEHAENKYS